MRADALLRAVLIVIAIGLACSPPAFFLEPVTPSLNGVVACLPRFVEAEGSAFVRPYTGGAYRDVRHDRGHAHDPPISRSAWAEVGERSYGMNRRYIEDGISFRVAVWGGPGEVDLGAIRFRLRMDDGAMLDPIRIEAQGSRVRERVGRGSRPTWRSSRTSLSHPRGAPSSAFEVPKANRRHHGLPG
jgi:hypothetical protein